MGGGPGARGGVLAVASAALLVLLVGGCGAGSGGSGASGTAPGPGGVGGLASLLPGSSGYASTAASPPDGASRTSGTPTSGAGSPTGATRTVDPAALPYYFDTPSRNIACAIVESQVRCDIEKHDWPTPARPASCEQDFGNGIFVGTGRADYTCAGDTILRQPTAEVLEYGQSVKVQDFTCVSQTAGVTCRNTATGHGFTLAKQAWAPF